MLIHLLNPLLQARNGTAVTALRWMPLFTLPVGDGLLTFHVVEAWCIRRPTGELAGEYASCLTAFAAAWRFKP